MKLEHELAKLLESELGKDLIQEIENKNYLPQESFKDCGQRAEALLYGAFAKVTKVLTLAIIEHRENSHEEDRAIERAVIESQLNEEEKGISTYTWWRN
jgi:S-ribosylhomocysteine lyase LuxS involved in autoinducer biosynthesis